MTEPQSTDEAFTGAGVPLGETASGEREDTRDLPLSEVMRRTMLAQGKVDPDAVFEAAEHVDLDDWPSGTRAWDERDDPAHTPPPIDPTQEELALEEPEPEPRDYTWEP